MPNTVEKYKKALSLSKDKNNQEARVELDDIIASDPEFIPAYFMRAICNAKLDNEKGITSDIATLLDKNFEKSELLHHNILADGANNVIREKRIDEIFLEQLHVLKIAQYKLDSVQERKAKELYLHGMICMAATLPEKVLDDVNALDKILPDNLFVQQLQMHIPMMIAEVKFEKELEQAQAKREASKSSASMQIELNFLKKMVEAAEETMKEQSERIKALEAEVESLRKAAVKPDANRLFSEPQRTPSPGRK